MRRPADAATPSFDARGGPDWTTGGTRADVRRRRRARTCGGRALVCASDASSKRRPIKLVSFANNDEALPMAPREGRREPTPRGSRQSPTRVSKRRVRVASEYAPDGSRSRTWSIPRGAEFSEENISSADDAGDGAAFRAPASTLTRWFARMFLPEDYPNSVSDDYAAFQAWDTAQGLCSYVRGSLTTKALLEGVGVGATGATAASAAAQFIARDMCGMVGGLVFTLAKGRHLDAEAKQWRLFADLANNVGMAMELAAPLANDRGWFLALACAGSVARSLCGCAAGATRAALTQHFARARNAADIAAKEGSQETAVTLVGMTLGVAVTTTTDGKTAWQWAVFVALTVAHVYCNVRAVRSLVIDSLNRERVRRLLARYDETLDEPSARGSDKVSAENSPRGLAKDEALLPVGMNWMLWPWYRYRGAREVRSVHLGAPVGSATREETIDLLRRLRDDGSADSASGHRPRGGRKYALASSRAHARRRRRTRVMLRVDAAAADQLEAYVHAALVSCAGSERNGDRIVVRSEAEADDWMRRHHDAFIATIAGWGWDTKDRVLLAADGWRVAWDARKDE